MTAADSVAVRPAYGSRSRAGALTLVEALVPLLVWLT